MCDIFCNFTVNDLVCLSVAWIKHLIWRNFSTNDVKLSVSFVFVLVH